MFASLRERMFPSLRRVDVCFAPAERDVYSTPRSPQERPCLHVREASEGTPAALPRSVRKGSAFP
jgi:hypothetical protein